MNKLFPNRHLINLAFSIKRIRIECKWGEISVNKRAYRSEGPRLAREKRKETKSEKWDALRIPKTLQTSRRTGRMYKWLRRTFRPPISRLFSSPLRRRAAKWNYTARWFSHLRRGWQRRRQVRLGELHSQLDGEEEVFEPFIPRLSLWR